MTDGPTFLSMMSDEIHHHASTEDWARDIRAVAAPPREEHNIAHDGRVLDSKEKMLSYLQEIDALRPKADQSG